MLLRFLAWWFASALAFSAVWALVGWLTRRERELADPSVGPYGIEMPRRRA